MPFLFRGAVPAAPTGPSMKMSMSLAATATANLVEELSAPASDTVSVIEAAAWLETTQRNVRKWLAQGRLEAGNDAVTGARGVLVRSVQRLLDHQEQISGMSRRQRRRHEVTVRSTPRSRTRDVAGERTEDPNPHRFPPLMAVLEEVEDFRRQQGRRYQLSTLLAVSSCAVLCGCRSFASINSWCQNQRALLQQFFEMDSLPTSHTLYLVFNGLDRSRLEAGLTEWAMGALKTLDLGAGRPPRSLYIRDGHILPGRYSSRIPGLVALTELGERLGLQEGAAGGIGPLDGAGAQMLRILLFEGSHRAAPAF